MLPPTPGHSILHGTQQIFCWSTLLPYQCCALDTWQRGALGRPIFDHWIHSLGRRALRSEEHTSELQSHLNLVCRLLLEKKKKTKCGVYTFTCICVQIRVEISVGYVTVVGFDI